MPAVGDTVIIAGPGAVEVNTNVTQTTAGSVTVNNGATLNATTTGVDITFGALTINSGGAVTLHRDTIILGATNITGTINFGSTSSTVRNMQFSGAVTLNSGAVWNETTAGAAATINFRGGLVNNATTFTTQAAVHTFNTNAQAISGTTTTSIPNTTVTGITVTNNGTLAVGTALAGTGGLTNTTTGTLNIGGTSNITTLTATAVGNTVNYTGAAQTGKVTTYSNLTLSGSLAKTFATTPTVNGILSIEGTATVAVTTGVVTYGAAATLQYKNTNARTASAEEWITPFAATGGVIIANTAGSITMDVAKVFNASVPLTINSGATLITNNLQLTLGGNFTNNGGTFTAGSSPIVIANTMATQSIAGFTTTGTVSMTKTAGTATLTGNVNGGALTLNGSGGTLDLGAGLAHTFTGAWTRTAGALLGNSSTLNIGGNVTNTAGTFTAGTSTVNLNGTGAQVISGTASTTFNNLTINGSGAKSATSDFTVNGILNLQSANPSAILGSLDMGGSTLTMGSDATTVGVGDVIGIVKRTTLVAGTEYTFGNQYTSINFRNEGTLPTEISIKITIGAAPTWKADGIMRIYDIAQTGTVGSGSFATLNLHYLDSELNSNTENTLVKWFTQTPLVPESAAEYGRSNYNETENWVGTGGFDVSLWPTGFDQSIGTLGDSVLANSTWNGSISNVWSNAANWTPNGIPSDLVDVIIPDAATTPNDPSPNPVLAIGRLTIEAGGILNTAAGSTITVSGAAGAWSNNGGTFNAGTGTVIFTNADAIISGISDFYNVTINPGAGVTMASGNTMRIAGTMTNNGTWRAAQLAGTTVEYNGASQTVLNPNGAIPGYSSLILSGSGTKTLPASNLDLQGDFINNGVAVTVTGNTINLTGAAGAQTIGGTTATTFNNLTINNSAGATLSSVNPTIAGVLTLTSGNITTGANNIYINSTGSVSGGSTASHVVGNFRKYLATGATSKTFEIGDASNYTPVSITFGNVTVAGDLTLSTTAGDHPNIGTSAIYDLEKVNRYWTTINSGISFDNFSAVFNFINPGDLDAGITPADFIVGKYSGGDWSYPTVGTKTSTSTQVTGLTSFSDFQLGEPGVAPNAPTLVSPANGSTTDDNTPTLSANYSDSDTDDFGTTNYRISSSSLSDCNNNINIVASGTSAITTTTNEDTTWTPSSSIGGNATYYWCAQNNDDRLLSAWTSMGNFILTNGSVSSSSSTSSNSSSSSAPVCGDTPPGAKAPWLYGAIAQDSGSVLLYFTPSDDPVDKYVLEYGTKSGDYPYGVQDMGVNSRGQMTFLVKSLSLNTIYYFRVRGGNGCATGPWSNEISAKTKGLISFNQLEITQSELESQPSTCQTYTVESGDTLWSIAKELLGDATKYKEIIEQNKDKYSSLGNSNNLKVEWELKVNCGEQTTTEEIQKQGGYDVNVKVVDTAKKPVEDAKVTIHSTVQETTTNKDGIAEFKNVEAGEHRILIAYKNFEGEQSVNLTGDVKEFDLNVTVQQKAVVLSPLVYGIIGIMGLVIIVLIVLLIKKRKV